jgi:hypothetical protein
VRTKNDFTARGLGDSFVAELWLSRAVAATVDQVPCNSQPHRRLAWNLQVRPAENFYERPEVGPELVGQPCAFHGRSSPRCHGGCP